MHSCATVSMNFHALLKVLNRNSRFRPFLDGVSSHEARRVETRLRRSAGWCAEKDISLSAGFDKESAMVLKLRDAECGRESG